MILTTIASVTIAVVAAAGDVSVPQSVNLDQIRALTVQHDGRLQPLDTVARDLVNSITGNERFGGHDPVALLLAWTFDAQTWRNERIIPIKNAELRSELKLAPDHKAFSFNELTSHRHLHSLADELGSVPEGQKLNPLQSKVRDIQQKLLTLNSIFLGRELRLIPDPDDVIAAWKVIPISSAMAGAETKELSRALAAVGAAFRQDDAQRFATAADTFATLLEAQPAAHRPARSLIETELHYNKLQPFRTAWQLMLVGAALAAAALVVRRKWFDAIASIGLVVGFAALSYGLLLRWQIAGRIPASNMYESLLFLSWGAGAFAIVSMFVIRNRTVPLTASALGAVALLLADILPMNHFIRPIAPVLLDTVWMSIHVPIIMVSYSVLALGVAIAHAQVITMAWSPGNRPLANAIDSLHYWYIHVGTILLLIGIVTGSMWGASSWGRYWGWDPKEVWSLVALLGYLTILHVRTDSDPVPKWAYGLAAVAMISLFVIVTPRLAPITIGKFLGLLGAAVGLIVFVLARGPFATAFKSILAFWLIIMTYVGVNYVLGIGLHSYGFGTGAIANYMLKTGGIDLALVLLCCMAYLIRRDRTTGSAAAPAVGY